MLFTALVMLIEFLCTTDSLNHGRDAKLGEFPYVVRVRISDLEDDARRIAAGVLMTTTRVLTTCDTVGYFTGETVNKHVLSRVRLLAGTVRRDPPTGGQSLEPISSDFHPLCHLLASEMVLFNFGFFLVADPGFHLSDNLKPVKNMFSSQNEMLDASYAAWEDRNGFVCFTAGWGYPTMAFEDKVEPDFFNSSSEILQTTELSLVDFNGPNGCEMSTCKEFGDCLINIWEYGLVCAKAKRGGPCRNDRGAPLICQDVFIGIHTNPQRCEDEGIPRHFARIDLVFNYVFNIKGLGVISTSADVFFISAATLIASEGFFNY